MKILVDAMGGDCPQHAIAGAESAAKILKNIDIALVGNPAAITSSLPIIPATELITNDDHPVSAIKTKRNSSMVVGLLEAKNPDIAFVSAGNTGALIAGATLHTGRINGIKRPALAPLIPTKTAPVMLIDGGANVDCAPEYLLQFAVMGAIYMKNVEHRASPKIGLLNIGTEEGKGNKTAKDAYDLLKDYFPNNSATFIGNVEARAVADGVCDVLVSDGFSGNIFLKSTEGAAMLVVELIKKSIKTNALTSLGGALLAKTLKQNMKFLDYSATGGAPLLGINGTIVKAHGSSNPTAFHNAILKAAEFLTAQIPAQIANSL